MSSSAMVIGFPDFAHKILLRVNRVGKGVSRVRATYLSILYTDHHSRRLYSLVVSSSDGSDISWCSPSEIAILSANPIYRRVSRVAHSKREEGLERT